jgi:hypothetical protein
MNLSNLGNTSTPANPLAVNNFFVPCVPLAVSTNLVSAEPLAKQLATSVASTAPELVNLSHVEFSNIQLKKSELRLKIDECAMADEALLDACLLNVCDLFANLTAYLMTLGRVAETDDMESLQAHTQASLKLIHDYAAAMGLALADYCAGDDSDAINPRMLFDACLKRVQALQKRWQGNYFRSIELALQLQRDAVYGAAASCLMEICQNGLDNQISLEPTPQAQEDVLVALATFVDAPFSGEWPVLRQRVIVLGHENTEGGVQ